MLFSLPSGGRNCHGTSWRPCSTSATMTSILVGRRLALLTCKGGPGTTCWSTNSATLTATTALAARWRFSSLLVLSDRGYWWANMCVCVHVCVCVCVRVSVYMYTRECECKMSDLPLSSEVSACSSPFPPVGEFAMAPGDVRVLPLPQRPASLSEEGLFFLLARAALGQPAGRPTLRPWQPLRPWWPPWPMLPDEGSAVSSSWVVLVGKCVCVCVCVCVCM